MLDKENLIWTKVRVAIEGHSVQEYNRFQGDKEFRIDLEPDLKVEVEEIHRHYINVGFEYLVRHR